MPDGLAFDEAALARDVAAAEGACKLVAGAALHVTIGNPYPPAAEAERRSFLRAFRWQFFAEVSRETPHDTRSGVRHEFSAAQNGLLLAAARLIPQAEIAAVFGVSHASVRARLCRLRKQKTTKEQNHGN